MFIGSICMLFLKQLVFLQLYYHEQNLKLSSTKLFEFVFLSGYERFWIRESEWDFDMGGSTVLLHRIRIIFYITLCSAYSTTSGVSICQSHAVHMTFPWLLLYDIFFHASNVTVIVHTINVTIFATCIPFNFAL